MVNADTPAILWGFIRRYNPDATPETMPFLDQAGRARHRLLPRLRPPGEALPPPRRDIERAALADLAETLRGLDADDADAEAIQNVVYEVGKRHPFPELRAWFGCLYQVLLGQQEGPRFGGFIALYGVAETIALIEAALAAPRRRAPDRWP